MLRRRGFAESSAARIDAEGFVRVVSANRRSQLQNRVPPKSVSRAVVATHARRRKKRRATAPKKALQAEAVSTRKRPRRKRSEHRFETGPAGMSCSGSSLSPANIFHRPTLPPSRHRSFVRGELGFQRQARRPPGKATAARRIRAFSTHRPAERGTIQTLYDAIAGQHADWLFPRGGPTRRPCRRTRRVVDGHDVSDRGGRLPASHPAGRHLRGETALHSTRIYQLLQLAVGRPGHHDALGGIWRALGSLSASRCPLPVPDDNDRPAGVARRARLPGLPEGAAEEIDAAGSRQ